MELEKLIKRVDNLKCTSTQNLSEIFDPEVIQDLIENWNLLATDKKNWTRNIDLRNTGFKVRTISRLLKRENPDLTFPEFRDDLLGYFSHLPSMVKTWNKGELKEIFTDEEIEEIEEFARQKLGTLRYNGLTGFEFKIYLFFYEDIPSFFYRKQIDDGILTFITCQNEVGITNLKCTNIWLD